MRPRAYDLEGVQVDAPRILFGFPRFVRQSRFLLTPRSVAKWFERAGRSSLDEVIERRQPTRLLVHGAHPWGRLALSAADRWKLPCFVIEHSADDLARAKTEPGLMAEMAWVAERCDGHITVSESMASSLTQLTGSQDIAVLENGIDRQTRFDPSPRELEGRTVILAAAHCYPRKGLELLVDAFIRVKDRLPDALLVVVTDATAALGSKIDRLGSAARLLPLLPNRELAQWMSWADLFALPSRNEAFGIVYAEALAAGTPLLLDKGAGIASTLQLAEGGEATAAHDGWGLESVDESRVCAALLEAASDPKRLRAMGLAAQVRATHRFRWSSNALQLAKAMGMRPQPRPAALTDGRDAA